VASFADCDDVIVFVDNLHYSCFYVANVHFFYEKWDSHGVK